MDQWEKARVFPYGRRFVPHSSHVFLALMTIFTNFKVQKHHDSQELTIPDLGHLNGYFIEKILAYANSTPHIALKMSLFYSKTNYF